MTALEAVPAPPAPQPAEPPISAGAALVGTFTQPAPTFERLAKRPTWWLPFVIGLLLGGISAAIIAPRMDLDRTVRQAMEKRAEKTGQTVTDAQVEQAVSIQRKFTAFAPAFAVVFGALGFFLVGLILWGGAQAMGGETRYGQVLAVWSHGALPNSLSAILAIPLFLARPLASLTQKEMEGVLHSNVGAFLPLDAPAALRAIASSLDVFTLAALVLLVIGFRKLPGLTKATGAAVPVGGWLLWVVIKTVWAALFG